MEKKSDIPEKKED